MTRKSAPLSFRINDDLRTSLELTAKRERRSVSSLVTIVLSDWIKENGVSAAEAGVVEDKIAARRYKALPGRPRKIPMATNDWKDQQVESLLDRHQDYELKDACQKILVIGNRKAGDNFDKGVENALLRNGWIEVTDAHTGRNVWITRERFDAQNA